MLSLQAVKKAAFRPIKLLKDADKGNETEPLTEFCDWWFFVFLLSFRIETFDSFRLIHNHSFIHEQTISQVLSFRMPILFKLIKFIRIQLNLECRTDTVGCTMGQCEVHTVCPSTESVFLIFPTVGFSQHLNVQIHWNHFSKAYYNTSVMTDC